MAAQFYQDRRDFATATRYAERGFAVDTSNTMAACILADVHIQQARLSDAVAVLEKCIEGNPSFHMGRVYIAQILKSTGEREIARRRLEELVAIPGVDAESRAKAQELLAAM